jgi:hypothetical protein
MRVTSTKTGGYAVSCGSCGYQGFAKSPKAAAGITSRMTPAPTPTPAPVPVAPKPAGKRLSDRELFGE